ncbi:MAG: response regulator [Candidatus Nealsonbacteria bacterium]|nr:response regulator [Candidatus Nealsonbacteria bacterium]
MNSQTQHILVVEDDSVQRNVVSFNLAKAGFRVTVAADVTCALKLVEHEHFDLIITDYYLPDLTGTDFVEKLRKIEEYAGTPVIFLTGRAKELNQEYLHDSLSALVVSKPYNVAQLMNIVSECLLAAHDVV